MKNIPRQRINDSHKTGHSRNGKVMAEDFGPSSTHTVLDEMRKVF
jgi:hypothetical protein